MHQRVGGEACTERCVRVRERRWAALLDRVHPFLEFEPIRLGVALDPVERVRDGPRQFAVDDDVCGDGERRDTGLADELATVSYPSRALTLSGTQGLLEQREGRTTAVVIAWLTALSAPSVADITETRILFPEC